MSNAKDVGAKRRVSLVARVAVAALAVLWVFHDQDWGELAGVFRRLNPWVFVLVLAVFAASQVVLAVRWWLLLRAQSIHISVLATVRLFFLGLFYNNVMPGAVGGDLLKAWYIAKHTDKRLEGVLSVVVDRVVGLFSLVLMALLTCSIFVPGGAARLREALEAGTPAWLTRRQGAFLWVGFVVLAVIAAATVHPSGRAVLRKVAGRAWGRGVELIRRINNVILLYCVKPLTLLMAILLTFLAQSVVIVAFWLLGRSLGMEAGLKYYFVVFPVMWVVSAVPVSIAGLGVLEGGIRWLFEFLTGAVAAQAVVLALCQRFVWVLASLPGGLIHLFGGHLPERVRETRTQPCSDLGESKANRRTGLGLAFLCAAASYQFLCAFQPPEFLSRHVFVMDDAFYYFQIARNLSDLHWATFDGIHATNGIQLLWLLILSPLAVFIQGRMEFARAILVLCVSLNFAAGIQLRHLGRIVHSPEFGDMAVLLWAGFLIALSPTMMGMEYSLHILIIVAIIPRWWTVLTRRTSPTRGQLLWLGALLTLNYWARLDSGIYSLLIWLSLVVTVCRTSHSWRASIGRVVVLTAVPALGLVLYAVISNHLAGTLTPISGIAKRYYAAQHFDDYTWLTAAAGHILWWVRLQCRAVLSVVSSVILAPPLFRPLPLAVLAIVLTVTVRGIRRAILDRAADPSRYRLTLFLALLWALGAIHGVLIVGTIGHFSHVTEHYYGWLLITWCLGVSLLIHDLLGGIRRARARHLVAVLGLVAFAAVQGGVAGRRFLRESVPGYTERRVRIASWIAQNTPQTSRIGAWNAGVLGYYSDRPVVNLDGLVNDREFLRRLQSAASIQDYLREQRITYLVDVDASDLTMPYRATWDKSALFRGILPWAHLDVLFTETSSSPPIYVLRLQQTGRTGDDESVEGVGR